MKRRPIVLAAAAFAVLGSAVLGPVAGARADQTGQGDQPGNAVPGGYAVSVQVHFTGNAAPGGGDATLPVTLHPVCWWEPAPGQYTDAQAMLDWYDGVTGGVQSPGMMAQYGPRSVWEDAVAREKNGQDLSWYKAFCYDPRNYVDYGLGAVDGGDQNPIDGNPDTFQVFLYRAFGAGEALPAPMVTPEELAEAARDQMVIPDPEIERNPKVHDTEDATLVGLPTYFWVTNAAAVGGEEGTRFIRAEVAGAGNAVWAEVTATTGGLNLDWPGGHKLCTPPLALTAYKAGMGDDEGCTVEFQHASTGFPGGYPVKASTAWQAEWVGPDGGGGLDPLATEVTVQIPVAEVQNIVEP